MECGSQEFLCELTNWLSENEMVGPWLVEVIGRFGAQAQGIAGSIAQFVRDYGQSIVGLIGVSFGFWRWWRYREHILHKRLAEYLRENDTRLANGTADLIELIQRPAPGQQFKDPLFIDDDLRVVLRERNWDKSVFALSVERSSDSQLSKAIRSIERRLITARDQMSSLNHQLASAHTIRGAIAASQGRRNGSDVAHERALLLFRSALSVPTTDNHFVKELEAQQQLKLGLTTAEQAFEKLLKSTETIGDGRQKKLLAARAKRYWAEAVRLGSPLNAWLMLTSDSAAARFYPGAVALIADCEPLSGWERIEKADAHYLAALCAQMQRFTVQEPEHLGEAESDYQRVLTELHDRRRRWPLQFARLRARAKEGLARVAAARNGSYDTSWLP
jgi:hypothetical protein